MSAPLASVILPTWNRAGLLERAARSVLEQTERDLELLVVDDGSVDDSAAVVAGLGDGRVRWLARPHAGISATMNAGMAAARGEFVARLDSDDRWRPDFLATLLERLRRAPAAALAYGVAEAMDGAGEVLPSWLGARRGVASPAEDTLAELVLGDFTCNIAIVARRAAIEAAADGGQLYDTDLRANEDWDLWLRVAHAHQRAGRPEPAFVFVDRVVAAYRLHLASITAPGSDGYDEVARSRLRVLDKLFARPDVPAAVRRVRELAYQRATLAAGQRLLYGGHPAAALAMLGRAFAHGRRDAGSLVSGAQVAWAVLGPGGLPKAVVGRWARSRAG